MLNCTLTLMSLSLQELWRLIRFEPHKPPPVRRVLLLIGALTLLSHPRHTNYGCVTRRKAVVVPPKPPKWPDQALDLERHKHVPPDRSRQCWQRKAPKVYVPRKPPFSYPTLNWKVLNGCILVSMWFYNMCLKSRDLLWHQWENDDHQAA